MRLFLPVNVYSLYPFSVGCSSRFGLYERAVGRKETEREGGRNGGRKRAGVREGEGGIGTNERLPA